MKKTSNFVDVTVSFANLLINYTNLIILKPLEKYIFEKKKKYFLGQCDTFSAEIWSWPEQYQTFGDFFKIKFLEFLHEVVQGLT